MTSMLFKPLSIGGMELENCITIAPMCQYSAIDGSMTDWHLMHLGSLALSGAAMLVIEAVIEKLSVKQAVFAELEPHLSPEAVLATNTSSLSVTEIATALARPGQVLGLHFFNPAPVMKLVELVPHPGRSTDQRTFSVRLH